MNAPGVLYCVRLCVRVRIVCVTFYLRHIVRAVSVFDMAGLSKQKNKKHGAAANMAVHLPCATTTNPLSTILLNVLLCVFMNL